MAMMRVAASAPRDEDAGLFAPPIAPPGIAFFRQARTRDQLKSPKVGPNHDHVTASSFNLQASNSARCFQRRRIIIDMSLLDLPDHYYLVTW
jgi:hypothetical protein